MILFLPKESSCCPLTQKRKDETLGATKYSTGI